jgi:cysteine-rich repeat protein
MLDAARDSASEMAARPDASSVSADVQRPPVDGPAQACGNSRLDPGEECDDGNAVSGDGCSSTCQLECDFGCDLPPMPVAVCGNGMLTANEACDDGNIQAGDGCSADCKTVEPGWRCPAPGRRCTPVCGDLIRMGSEECEDGNVNDGDGCSSTCLTEPGWDCSSGTCVPITSDGGSPDSEGEYRRCGDGIVSGAEECDDGALNDDTAYGGCSTRCLFIGCGDGVVNGSEKCDLGPRNGLVGGQNGCTIACTRPHYCGDGIVDISLGEECDLGERNGVMLDSSGLPSNDPSAHCLCNAQCALCEGVLYSAAGRGL